MILEILDEEWNLSDMLQLQWLEVEDLLSQTYKKVAL